MNMLAKAIMIASTAFAEKTDRGGKPYILHCLYVMHGVEDLGEHAMIAAVLHDLLEDTAWTADQLLNEGFHKNDIEIIKMLTHGDESYDEYITRVALNRTARRIKMKDLEHNSNIHRMKGLRDKDFNRLEKYFRSYAYLRDCDCD